MGNIFLTYKKNDQSVCGVSLRAILSSMKKVLRIVRPFQFYLVLRAWSVQNLNVVEKMYWNYASTNAFNTSAKEENALRSMPIFCNW